MGTGKEVPVVCHRLLSLQKKSVDIYSATVCPGENTWTCPSQRPRWQSPEGIGVRTGLSNERVWTWCAAGDLVWAVEEDKPRWKCRWEAEMALEQPQALGFWERNQNGSSSLQIGRQANSNATPYFLPLSSTLLPVSGTPMPSLQSGAARILPPTKVASCAFHPPAPSLVLHTYYPHLTQS